VPTLNKQLYVLRYSVIYKPAVGCKVGYCGSHENLRGTFNVQWVTVNESKVVKYEVQYLPQCVHTVSYTKGGCKLVDHTEGKAAHFSVHTMAYFHITLNLIQMN